MNPDFGVYQLGAEHEALRETVRALAEKEIAPYAAEVDEHERFPHEALAALVRSGFHAVHVPQAYDGEGADSISTCIVIEEVARVCASSSLIPAVNKLGTMGLLLSGSDELKKQVLPSVATGDAMVSYALSEREAGSDAAGMRTNAHTRPTIGAQAVGIAQGALDASIAYVKERRQFGHPISDFQGVQFMLADMAIRTEA